MSTSSPRRFRCGECLISASSDTVISSSSSEPNINVEKNVNFTSEQTQTTSDSPIKGFDSQQTNEERFHNPQTEMSTLKAMMEKLIQQNEEKDRQNYAYATPSSSAVRMSYTL